jgi:hypothetical protein
VSLLFEALQPRAEIRDRFLLLLDDFRDIVGRDSSGHSATTGHRGHRARGIEGHDERAARESDASSGQRQRAGLSHLSRSSVPTAGPTHGSEPVGTELGGGVIAVSQQAFDLIPI